MSINNIEFQKSKLNKARSEDGVIEAIKDQRSYDIWHDVAS